MEGLAEVFVPLGVGGVLAYVIWRSKEQSDLRYENDRKEWLSQQQEFSERSLQVIGENTRVISSVVQQWQQVETLQKINERLNRIEDAQIQGKPSVRRSK